MTQRSVSRLGHVGSHAFDIEKERAFIGTCPACS
jgi:hypothetical protein